MSETLGELEKDADPEPEPSGHWKYVNQVLKFSETIDNGGQYILWNSDSGDSQVVIQPWRIRARMTQKAFENYVNLSVDDRHTLEHMTAGSMDTVSKSDTDQGARVLVNYVPLLFMDNDKAIVGVRERDDTYIAFESDEIESSNQRKILVGGLATILYFMDYPHELRSVE